MDQKNQPPSPPSVLLPPPPPPPEAVEINLQPETPQPTPPQLPGANDTADPAQEKRKKLVDRAQTFLANAYDALAELAGPEGMPANDALGRAILEVMARANADDALLSYDIRFSNKDGEIFQFTGHNLLHSFSAQQMLSEGPRNFEALLYTALFRPMKAQVQNYLNTFVKNDNPLTGDPTFSLNNIRPEIREAGSDSFITPRG